MKLPNRLPNRIERFAPFLAGVLLGISMVTPAFAATLDVPLPPRDWLLVGSLVLLAVALALRLMRSRATADEAPDAPDLRWWMRP